MDKPKETAYDNEIYPLMEQIIAICEREGINMHATYSLDSAGSDLGNVFCSTTLPSDESDQQGLRMLIGMAELASEGMMPGPEEPAPESIN